MAETATKLPVNRTGKEPEKTPATSGWHPLETLQHEVDRLFRDFNRGWPLSRAVDFEPMWQMDINWGNVPAVDVVEKEKAFEVTAELPGMDEKNIDVSVSNGMLTIKGEKQEDKEEKKKGYYLSERRFGSFERSFRIPVGVDPDKIDASFKKGVLTVTLPKKPEAQKPEKKISVKAA
jgi:HSP20 family protein